MANGISNILIFQLNFYADTEIQCQSLTNPIKAKQDILKGSL